MERAARPSEGMPGPIMGRERGAPGTAFVCTRFYGRSTEPSVGELVVWRWLATYLGMGMAAGCFIKFLFIELFAIHVGMWTDAAALVFQFRVEK